MADVFSELFQQLWNLRIVVYSNVASLALLIYDWQLTFGDEVNVIWMSKARLSRLLFFWIRYSGIAIHTFIITMYLTADPSPTFCAVAIKFQIAEPHVMWWSVELVFALRVWILYKRSRKLLVFLAAMYAASIGVSIVLPIKALVHIDLVGVPGLGSVATGCHDYISSSPGGAAAAGQFQTVPTFLYASFIIGNVTTSILCILTVYQTIRFRNGFARSALISLFLRDGVIYYLAVSVVFLLNLFMFRFGNAEFQILFSGFLDVVPCMSGTRVLINILSLVRKESGVDETALPYSEPKFVPQPISGDTCLSTSIGTRGDVSMNGAATVDSTQCNTMSGAMPSKGMASMSVGVIEEVVRMGTDDAEK